MRKRFKTSFVWRYVVYCNVALCLCGGTNFVFAQDARAVFSQYSERIYQVRIVDRVSGKRAGIGSGFLVNGTGKMITNYHVVSEYADHPERYRIEYVSHTGNTGALSLIDLDVINDLALLQLKTPVALFLQLAAELPEQGEAIYSIGNPHDLGWTVIPGTYNGITARSLYERIHFSGSVNPGMSGGPVLNERGRVIGVNVSTAGNQMSFLVPLHRLKAFLQRSGEDEIEMDSIDERVGQQLRENQRQVLLSVLSGDWKTVEFGRGAVPSEISEHISCWGRSDDTPDIRYEHSVMICNSDEQIYLGRQLNTGNIVYQFDWLETNELNAVQFYNMYQEKVANVYPDNEATEEHVTEFSCHDGFVAQERQDKTPVVNKATFCVRSYKNYQGLFDVLYIGGSVHQNKSALVSHFTLAGVEKDVALGFLRKFMTSIKWN